MPVYYNVVSKKSVLSADQGIKYYPQLTNRRVVDLRAMCNIISEKSTLNSSDIMGVVEALVAETSRQLKDGRNVKLDNLGTFSLHASANGKDNPEQVTSKDIKKLKVSFLASPYLKHLIKFTNFAKVKKRKKK